MVNSCQKGKRFEREVAAALRGMFPKLAARLRRGRQFSGSPDSPDVVGLPGFHIEAKHVNRLNVQEAMDQAVRDAGPDSVPVVVHRRDRTAALVTLRLIDVPRAVRSITDDAT